MTIPHTRSPSTRRSSTAASITSRPGTVSIAGLHGLTVEPAVGLGPWPLDGGALALVQDPKLNAGRIGDPAHQAVKRIDFADEMALAEPANGRIARHLANRVETVRDERCLAPMRAAAAASHPAWPPPITTTS